MVQFLRNEKPIARLQNKKGREPRKGITTREYS